MANLEDFKRVHEDLVHDYAGDDRLEEFGSVVESIILLAKQKERERIIALLIAPKKEGDLIVYRWTKAGSMGYAVSDRIVREFLAPKP